MSTKNERMTFDLFYFTAELNYRTMIFINWSLC